MSRFLARAKLNDAQQALRCLKSNIEGAAEQLSGVPGMEFQAAGLVLFEAGLAEMEVALRSILRDLDPPPAGGA